MTPLQFIMWLQGFLEASGNSALSEEQLTKLKKTLDKVSDLPTYPQVPAIIGPLNRRHDNLVPYHTICSCNPANGGSGICGCVIGNKLVPSDSKNNIYTTTTDNIGYNWEYKNIIKANGGPELLHD